MGIVTKLPYFSSTLGRGLVIIPESHLFSRKRRSLPSPIEIRHKLHILTASLSHAFLQTFIGTLIKIHD